MSEKLLFKVPVFTISCLINNKTNSIKTHSIVKETCKVAANNDTNPLPNEISVTLMPNTLIHIAIQSPASRVLIAKAEIPWIFLGAILPDIPWIVQRILLKVGLFDPLALRIYVITQASLFFCLILSFSLCWFSPKPKIVFTILAFNSLFHLLLDATQVKWGNGVHLFAPFSWHLSSFNFFWPENIFIAYASITGFLLILVLIPHIYKEGIQLTTAPKWKRIIPSLLLYFLLPFLFSSSLWQNNPSYVATIADIAGRPGNPIEIDRGTFKVEDATINMLNKERIRISGDLPAKSGIVSIQGVFLSENEVFVNAFHFHTYNRDLASKTGLAMILFIWFFTLFSTCKHYRTRKKS